METQDVTASIAGEVLPPAPKPDLSYEEQAAIYGDPFLSLAEKFDMLGIKIEMVATGIVTPPPNKEI